MLENVQICQMMSSGEMWDSFDEADDLNEWIIGIVTQAGWEDKSLSSRQKEECCVRQSEVRQETHSTSLSENLSAQNRGSLFNGHSE